MKMRDVGGAFLDLLFPKRCPWCDKVVGFSDHNDCEETLNKLHMPPGPVLLNPGGKLNLDAVWACYRYEPPVSEAIRRFKLTDAMGLAADLGPPLAARYGEEALAGRFDLIVPVPVSPRTQRRRGYNQSALLAAGLAAETGLPCEEGILLKTRETRPQRDLGRAERLTNVLGAYEVAAPAKVEGRRILLVDDVATTGATLNECAATLRAAGVAACGALCLASA